MSGQPAPDAELDEALALVNDDHGRRTGRLADGEPAGGGLGSAPGAPGVPGAPTAPTASGDLGHEAVPQPPSTPAASAASLGPAPSAAPNPRTQGAAPGGDSAGQGARRGHGGEGTRGSVSGHAAASRSGAPNGAAPGGDSAGQGARRGHDAHGTRGSVSGHAAASGSGAAGGHAAASGSGAASGHAAASTPGEPSGNTAASTPGPSSNTTSSSPHTSAATPSITPTPSNASPHTPTPTSPHNPPTPQAKHRNITPWPTARAVAARAPRPVASAAAPPAVPLRQALGLVLAAPLVALTDLPSFDTSAMDGWVVAGPGPWEVRADGILAGHGRPDPLSDGEAVRIATGARIPQEATAVIRSEHGLIDARGRLHPQRDVTHGQDIRPRGQECRSGDQLLPPGVLVTPAVLGLAAAAGYDELPVVPRPRAEVLILGDELLTDGLPHEGLIRDALGPMLPPWLRSLGAEVIAVRRLGDDAEALHQAVTTSTADLIVTTGGTASGPVDHVHPILGRIGAELLVDGVAVRPGHPMLLARIRPDQHLVGLPGNPLAAVSGLLTLAEPLLRTLSGRPAPSAYTAVLREDVHGHPHDTRLVPVTLRADQAVPLRYNGPAMLRGIAVADGLAVVPPGGGRRGQELEVLDLPWTLPESTTDTDMDTATDVAGECFT